MASDNLHCSIEVSSLLQTDDRDFIMAVLDRQKNKKLSEFVDTYFDINATDLSAALKQYLEVRNISSAHELFRDLALVYKQQMVMWENLQSFKYSLEKKVDCLKLWTIVAGFLLTTAAVICTVVAAAAAKGLRPTTAMAAGPVLFGAICTWVLALLKKHKNEVNKHKKITRFMIVGVDTIIKDLFGIYVLARALQWHTESLSEIVDKGAAEVTVTNKMAALEKSFQKLQGQANLYCRNIHRVRTRVFNTIIEDLD